MGESDTPPRCCRCHFPATFEHPRRYCDEHWARWMGGFDPSDPPADGDGPSETMYEEALFEARICHCDGTDEEDAYEDCHTKGSKPECQYFEHHCDSCHKFWTCTKTECVSARMN